MQHLASDGQDFVRRGVPYFVHQKASQQCGKTDRKSTRLNSSHLVISYAVFCLKKKKKHRPVLRATPENQRAPHHRLPDPPGRTATHRGELVPDPARRSEDVVEAAARHTHLLPP